MALTLCDVGPRDGLQNEPDMLASSVRAELVNKLAAAGLRRIEAVSFVRDDRIPQMAGAEEVVAAIEMRDGVEYAGLVLNEEGFGREVDPGVVLELAGKLEADELVLADTIGVATPSAVRSLVERVGALGKPVGFHGHNTRNTGYANALVALEAGATVLAASTVGLGGCPYAPRATGNIATEDLVYLLEGEGVETGVDLGALVEVSQWLETLLGRQLEGQVYRAGVSAVVSS